MENEKKMMNIADGCLAVTKQLPLQLPFISYGSIVLVLRGGALNFEVDRLHLFGGCNGFWGGTKSLKIDLGSRTPFFSAGKR